MKVGRFTIEQLSEGQYEIFGDGSIHRSQVGDTISQTQKRLRAQNTSRIGIDPVFITDGKHNILLDTGLGWGLDAGSSYQDISNIQTNLDIFGKTPDDITHVILTHLHYDHIAGASFTDNSVTTTPTFPNARYYVQRREWEYALSNFDNNQSIKEASYQLDDFYRLVADNRVEFLDDDFTELLPELKIFWTGGHTPGHQVVRIGGSKGVAYYLGDLLPSEYHLNQYAMRKMDVNPLQSKKLKVQLLRTAYKENAVLLFYHSLFSKAGILERDRNKKYVLKKV